MKEIRLFDILWRTKNAGPSPDDNRRTELYFAGCDRALSGNPCKNCFNPLLWDRSNCYPKTSEEIVNALDRHNIPKYITIVGGEPTDQLDGLVELSTILKKRGYHTMLFSWRSMDWIKEKICAETINNFNIIVTDPYIEAERIYDTAKDDGIHNVVGSGNQNIWLPDKSVSYKARDIASLKLKENNELEVEFYVRNGS